MQTNTHTCEHTHTHTHTHLYIEKSGNVLLRDDGFSVLLYYKTSLTQRYMNYINTYMHTPWIIFETPVLGTGSQLVCTKIHG